jgi:hypothetical protein
MIMLQMVIVGLLWFSAIGCGIADGLVDHVDHNDSDSREQLAFAVNHSRQLLEDLRRRYYEHERTED